jgi:hypothetical protein
VALVEFALVLPLLLILVLVTIDFGHLVQTRLIVTNVSREGGSIGSRQDPIDADLPAMVLASGRPLDLAGPEGKVFITRIDAGRSADEPEPTVTTQIERGGLAVGSGVGRGRTGLGLTRSLYERLVFKPDNGTADIAEVTVVEVFYRYRPITPLANFVPGLLPSDAGGVIIGSRSVF